MVRVEGGGRGEVGRWLAGGAKGRDKGLTAEAAGAVVHGVLATSGGLTLLTAPAGRQPLFGLAGFAAPAGGGERLRGGLDLCCFDESSTEIGRGAGGEARIG